MPRPAIAVCAAALTVALLLPAPVRAFDEQTVLQCALTRALAILTCKKPEQFQYMGMREGVHVYNTLFGSRFVEFYVQIQDKLAIFSSRAWNGRMASGQLHYNYPDGCVTVAVDPLPCSRLTEAKCCGD